MMSLWGAILGSFWLGVVALMSFMMTAFAGGGIGNGGKVAPWMMTILDASLFVLPSLSIVGAVMLWVAYINDWGSVHNWWAAFPLPFIVVYFVFIALVWK